MPARYDAARVRGLYTGLSDGWTYLNAHDTPQLAERVAAGVARSFRMSTAVASFDVPTGTHSARPEAGRLEGHNLVDSARIAVADLVGASADRVVLGPSLPALYQALAQVISPLLRSNSSVVLSRLDPPVLARAFRGELVPQDPADEPASVLLDRIRAQRAAAPKPKRGRRASGGKQAGA